MGNATSAGSERASARPDPADSMHNAGAGWYYDPDDEAVYRYWDGQEWTGHRSDTCLSAIPT